MNRAAGSRLLIVTALLALLAPVVGSSAELTDDGLERIKVSGIDKAYKRPGATLAGYRSVLIKPVTVGFSKSWDPRDYGDTPAGLRTKDVERIRTDLAKLAEESFSDTLSRGGYMIATQPGPGVLEVEANIVDLFINAPDAQSSALVRTYVMSVGEMRLNAELRDSVTGTLLYRVSDHKRGAEDGRLEWANSVWNQAELARMLDGWALRLKKALDASREGAK
ncbi:MAG: DUF3313 family protein [Steroidobacteraceae bacterium]